MPRGVLSLALLAACSDYEVNRKPPEPLGDTAVDCPDPVEPWGVSTDPACVVDGVYQTALARPITRGGGTGDYFDTTQDRLFRMTRPA